MVECEYELFPEAKMLYITEKKTNTSGALQSVTFAMGQIEEYHRAVVLKHESDWLMMRLTEA